MPRELLRPMKTKLLCIIFATILCFSGRLHVSADQSNKDLLGADFVDLLTFFGESTTSHLACRSKVSKARVWTNSSGTARLDSTIASRPIQDPRSGQLVTPVELASREQPEFLVLSFGLNGIMTFAGNTDDYLTKYQKLIDALAKVSPNTHFFIQAIYPVADSAHQSDWQFSVSPSQINQKINLLNDCLEGYCRGLSNVDFVDTSVHLKNEQGFLSASFTTDGIHLNESAYNEILERFREYGESLPGMV